MNQRYHGSHQSDSAGSVLAQARERLALTISDVARHLKLSPAQVEALEEGAYERLPGRVFVRGFLRNYAKLLGVDPQPLLRSMERAMPQPVTADEPPPSAEVEMPRGERAGWPLYVGLFAVVIVGALAIYEFGFNDAPPGAIQTETSNAQQNAESSAAAARVPPASSAPASASAPVSAQSNPLPVSSAPGALPGGIASGSRGALDSTSTGPGSVPLPEKAVRPGERELHFRFDQESWVEIRDRNDKVIFSKLNRAGAEERLAAVPPLKLVVGNARGVRLVYREQTVDLTPHIGVTVARLTLQ